MTRLARTASPAMTQWPTLAVYAALPTLGLVAGPSYAALVFGLGFVQLLGVICIARRLPVVDPALALLAVALVAMSWASVAWAIDPAHSRGAALQVTVIFAGVLVFLAATPLPDEKASDRLFLVLAAATVLGAAIIALDWSTGDRFQSLVMHRPGTDAATKYNRGIDYLVLIAWPQLAFAVWRRRWRQVVVVAASLVAVLVVGVSLAGQAAALAGIVVFALAIWLPRTATGLLAAGTVALAMGAPLGLRLLAIHRADLAAYLKGSGFERLEIWDPMTAHVLERPFLGWGIGDADTMPDAFLHNGHGVYPHNQWLELWVETGAIGAIIGLALALLTLRRIGRLAPPIRPYALAAFAAAVVISCVNFEVTTDSWWAALAASAWLFAALNHRIRAH
jgi:exopolysaccharide production protein ExoQ